MTLGCVVLTNYEGSTRGFLHRALATLSKSLDVSDERDMHFGVIIVDDGSRDDSLKVLREFRDKRTGHNEVKILRTSNGEATVAMNAGIRYVFDQYPECKYVITLDNDIALSAWFLTELVQKAQSSSKRTGMFGSNAYMLESYPQTIVHRSTGHYVDKAGVTRDGDFRNKEECKNKSILCPCLCGALFRIEMMREVGLIPEEYTHYNNCSELGFRARLGGWEFEFAASAVLWHNWKQQLPPDEKTSRACVRDLPRTREISRIWNILRFFPREKIDSAIDEYRKEHYRSSPKCLQQKEELIEEAKDTCPHIPNGQKEDVYERFVASNG